jgi:multiple sugar transport system permease protein
MKETTATAGALSISKNRARYKRLNYLKDTGVGYSFIAPTTILFTIFYFLPLIFTFSYSFYNFDLMNPQKTFVGMENYSSIIKNPDFRSALFHTVTYSVFTVFFSTVVSLFFAVLLNMKIRGKSIYRTIYFFPVIAPSVATSIVFTNLFSNDKSGTVNQILSVFHIHPIAWLGDAHYAMATIIIYSVWCQIGYNMLIYMAGLQNINQEYYEAARLDGANSWQIFRTITLPLLKPTTLFVVVVGVIGAFQVFNQVYIMTQGGPLNATTVLVYQIYQEAFQNFHGGTASAMSVILFAILLVLSIVQIKLFSNKE